MLSKKMNAETKARRSNLLWMLASVSLLVVIGLENILSSTFVLDEGASLSGYLGKQLGFLVAGVVIARVIWKLGYQFIRLCCSKIFLINIVCLIAVKFVGITVNGARRWLGFGAFSFQPSEFAKLAAIITMAAAIAFYLERHGNKELMSLHLRNIFPIDKLERKIPFGKRLFALFLNRYGLFAFFPTLFFAFLVALQPDAGTAIVIFFPVLMMFFCCELTVIHTKFSWKQRLAFAIGVVALIGLGVYLFAHSYQMMRIVTWWDPWPYSQSSGYQTVQSYIAVGSGGVFGQGMGTGISKFNYLPEAHTDFAFAVIAQEWGLIGAVTVLFLFCSLLSVGVKTAIRCRDRFGTFLALGITFSLCIQGLINMAMVTGIVPVVGVPLPFISYGGSSLILNIISVTFLLRISYDNFCEAEAGQADVEQEPF